MRAGAGTAVNLGYQFDRSQIKACLNWRKSIAFAAFINQHKTKEKNMSIFSSDLVSKPLLTDETYVELVKNLFLSIDLLNRDGAVICWENDTNTLSKLIEQHIEKKSEVNTVFGRFTSLRELVPNLDNPLSVPTILLQQKGRSVLAVDCRLLGKGDAIGFLYRLSQLSTASSRPIVIISNIADLLPEDVNHDAPETIKNLLLHLWKDDTRELLHRSEGKFVIHRSDYTILIPIPYSKQSYIDNSRLRNNNLAQIKMDTDWRHWKLDNNEALSYLEKRGWISSELANDVRAFHKESKGIVSQLSYCGKPKNSLQFGKAVEYAVFANLIMSGGELFLPSLDDDGVDVLVKRPDGKYVSVQIKATSCQTKDPGFFAAISHRPRQDYWFVFFSESLKKVWVMNSQEFIENASFSKKGNKSTGEYSINFGKHGTLHSEFIATDFSRLLY